MATRSALLAGLVLFGCQREETTSPVPPAPQSAVTEEVEPSVRATNTEGAAVTVESVTEVFEPEMVGSETIVIEDTAPATTERQARQQPVPQRRSTKQPAQTNTTDQTDTTESTDDPIGTDAQNQGIGGGDTYDRNR